MLNGYTVAMLIDGFSYHLSKYVYEAISSLPERDIFDATIGSQSVQKARIQITSHTFNTSRLSNEINIILLPADVVRYALAHWNIEQKVRSQDATIATLRCHYGPAMQLILYPAD
jgi:hypothetical protein